MKDGGSIVENEIYCVEDFVVFIKLLVVVSVECVLVFFERILLECVFIVLDFECYCIVKLWFMKCFFSIVIYNILILNVLKFFGYIVWGFIV